MVDFLNLDYIVCLLGLRIKGYSVGGVVGWMVVVVVECGGKQVRERVVICVYIKYLFFFIFWLVGYLIYLHN
ncbi:hypothetical protein HanRHA438_Chr03g0102341 [Helianthus annuus]|nr:hypothetical protein HanIR_Chr12g0615551 [Helianthus annuus]KAJ0933987.1 hypothetical protein HanRHA438_Chr03g0102341 [Helianthus annuus]